MYGMFSFRDLPSAMRSQSPVYGCFSVTDRPKPTYPAYLPAYLPADIDTHTRISSRDPLALDQELFSQRQVEEEEAERPGKRKLVARDSEGSGFRALGF